MSNLCNWRILAVLSALPLSLATFQDAHSKNESETTSPPSTLGQSGWTRPGSVSTSSSGLGQSEWISPAQSTSNSSTLGQSKWIKSGKQKKDSIPIALGQSGWNKPEQEATYSQTQSMPMQPMPMQMPMQSMPMQSMPMQNMPMQQQPMTMQMQPIPMQGMVNQTEYNQAPQFFQAPAMNPSMGMNGDMGYGNMFSQNAFSGTDNVGKALGIASQLGIDTNQSPDYTNTGSGINAPNMAGPRMGIQMPYIPGTRLINRNADRALQRVLNRAIQKL